MVSEGGDTVMSSACADFTQNAWKKDLCVNCQRPRGEHPAQDDQQKSHDSPKSVKITDKDSPKPAKRNSLMTKSWTLLEAEDKASEDTEEDQWNSMCLPDPDQPDKPLADTDQRFTKQEHCYEDIDGEQLKQNSGASKSTEVLKRLNEKKTVSSSLPSVSKPSENSKPSTDKSITHPPSSRDSASRSRSSSRDKSPAPAIKPKPMDKVASFDRKKSLESNTTSTNTGKTSKDSDLKSSQKNRKKLNKDKKSLSFVEDPPDVIGEDGGVDNLYSDNEEELDDTNDNKEIMNFTEDEKDWAMQALKNTIFNTEQINSVVKGEKKDTQSKEYEDIKKLETLLKPDRFSNVRDCEPLPERQDFGTFPLRTKTEKSAMENLFSGNGNRLSVLSETAENAYNLGDDNQNKYESVVKFLGSEIDFSSSPKHKGVKDATNDSNSDGEPSYDDPWGDKFAFDTESEMNLFDEIRSEIDLDSSTAGLALVDLLNDVLAKYSTGTPSETDSIKNFDLLDDEKLEEICENRGKKEGREKPTELDAKIVTLAASLRAKRAKGRAPRPPSCPPEPPPDSANSPAKQAELRAAQSKEPTFKMVPIGKPIGGNPLSQSAPPSTTSASPQKTEPEPVPENMEGYKIKKENDKQKKGGGFGGFFSRFLRRGRDSESDLSVSSETLVSNPGSISDTQNDDSDNQSEKGSNSDKKLEKGDNNKPDKRNSKSSPQMKVKVLQARPISPKPPDKPPNKDFSKENELRSSQKAKKSKDSPILEPKSKAKPSESVEKKTSSPKAIKTDDKVTKVKLSPTKTGEPLAASPKSKEAPPLPLNPPRDISDASGPPKPRPRGNSEGGVPRSRPRTRDITDGKPQDKPAVPPPKPPVAMKPRPPSIQNKSLDISDNSTASAKTLPSQKDRLSSTLSLDGDIIRGGRASGDPQKITDPKVLRKRAKSPKRMAAPTAPGRTSMPNLLTDSNTSLASNTSEASLQSAPGLRVEQKGISFSKELELKLNKEQGQHSNIPETRKMSAPPKPPSPSAKPDADKTKTKADINEKSKSLPKENTKTVTIKDKEICHSNSLKETSRSKNSSKDDLKTSVTNEENQKPVTMETDNQSQAADVPVLQPEKIELPKPVGSSRKSFLGKLNRKNKPTAPPSVKRTKSITESSIHGDTTLKKIDLKDISGPVLITDMSSHVVVNRRNTISLGDDNSFLSGGSTSSGSTSGEKSDSPRGSAENLYEFITSEAPTPPIGDKKNFYDPVIDKTIGLRPSSICGSEGYLEPVRSNQSGVTTVSEPVHKSNMADSTISLGSMTTSMASNMAAMSKSTISEDFESAQSVTNNHDHDNLAISEERRDLLASQPIYEEINGYGKLGNTRGQGSNIPEEIEEEQIYGVGGDPMFNSSLQNSAPAHEMNISQNTTTLPSMLKSKDSFSSESDVSSTNNSLSRPRPQPRKRPRQVGSGFEQYVAMNRPSVAVFLNEELLREMLSRLAAMNLQTLREIYTQHEKCFTKENLQLSTVGPLKWHDFNIYGKPLHTSDKCVVYNAKMKSSVSPCQVMLLHTRPEITSANHPSLLKPTCIFTDSIPFSYLTDEFIKTSQILETCVNQSNANMAKCYVVVGLFDITESLTNHLTSLKTSSENQKDFLRKVSFFVLQLLSAISHCLEMGHPIAEADFHDLYLISNPNCLGETVSFLPQLRAPEDQQIDSVCLFLEKFLQNMCARCEANSVLDDSAFFTFTGIQKVIDLLQSGVTECLPIVRSYTEFLLWGPEESDMTFQDRQSNVEPKLAMWLEYQRTGFIHDFAKRVQHDATCNIMDFYKMKFLLKASSGSLAECIRCHMSAN